MVLQLPSSQFFCYCGMKRRRLGIPCADCGCADSNSPSPAAPLSLNNLPVITPSSGRVYALRCSATHPAGPAAAGAAVGLMQKVLGSWHYPADCGSCPAAFTLLHGEELSRRAKPERCIRQAECSAGKVSEPLAIQPLGLISHDGPIAMPRKRPYSPPDAIDMPPMLCRVAADPQPAGASPQLISLRPIPASEQFARPQAPWSFPADNLETYSWLRTGCSPAATIPSTTPPASATTAISSAAAMTTRHTSIAVSLPTLSISTPGSSKLSERGCLQAKSSVSMPLASSKSVAVAGGSDTAAAAMMASASVGAGVGAEGIPDWAAATAAPSAQMWCGAKVPLGGGSSDGGGKRGGKRGDDDRHVMYLMTCTSNSAPLQTTVMPEAAAVPPSPAPSVGATATPLSPALPEQSRPTGRVSPSPGLCDSSSSAGKGSRLLLRLWPLGKQPQAQGEPHIPPPPMQQSQPHFMAVSGAVSIPQFGAGVVIESPLGPTLPLARLERLLQAAEAAAAAATACAWSLTHGTIAGETAKAATVIERAFEASTRSGCLEDVGGGCGSGSSRVAAGPLPALRVDPLEYFEVDGGLLKGAVLQTACNVIRLVQLSNSLAIVPPWAPAAAQDLRATAAAASTFGDWYGKLSGSGSGGCLGHAPFAVQPGRRRGILPLVAALRVLVAFAGASRALQKAQAERTETTAAVTDGLTALLPLMRRGCACAELLMEKVERVLTEEPRLLDA
ncbi:hypothetical protein Vafri_17218 [Volvox africanus]|uniref:Uncharacterized protein n=1 Tax=Volvox africanus TaxID=51714 RepID=A0A8J4BJS7_9CHLO|nr:hypothetical protein Vafri_17218 [Volvox africanus]